MKDNPSPGAYNESKNDYNNRGPSFGLSYKYYQKVMIPKEMINLSKVQVDRSKIYLIQNSRRLRKDENDQFTILYQIHQYQ